MDPAKSAAEDRSAEQAASLFRNPDPENQRHRAATNKKINSHWKVIIAVLLLCFLVVVLAIAFSLKKGSKEKGKVWLQGPFEDLQQPQCPPGFSKPPLILVSLDGFRAEYLKDHKKHGTTTPYMRPVYPTKTFPNHYSIVTGLYPESHGIVDNKMYDLKRNAFFSLKTDEKFNAQWYQGEPVWVTAMRQNLKAATFFWPGSDVNITGTFPTFYHMYDKNINFEKRVTTVFDWLNLPQGQRPDFFTMYLDEPDSAGHRYGPGSKEVIEALENVDRIIGMLMDGLKERNLHKCVNLIIVSDHGMEEASCDKAAFVSSFVNNTEDFSVIQGPAARIRPTRLPQEYSTFDYEGLIDRLSCRTPDQPMRPYLKEHLPKRMHFAHHERIERGQLYMKEAGRLLYLLGIRPAPNNGTHGSLNHLLKKTQFQPVHPAQLSHDTPCVASNATPSDDRQCSCTGQTTEMAKVDPSISPCVRADVRIDPSKSQMCSRYRNNPGLTFGLLHPPNVEAQGPQTGSLLNTNMVPMFPAFLAIWEHIHTTLLPKYSQKLNGVNIMSGPIFDEDYDGNVDKPQPVVDSQAPTPTHFFLILTSCGNSSLSPGSCSGPLKVQSFILPHRPDYKENCASGRVEDWAEKWMKFHTARVRDVELLTGLSFYHDRISVDETLRLKTYLQTA
ncbi:hypothetical protein WMY93_015925 [Mugilogobius chulae]|uniref:ENPP1-3/EXOG-like endonuclease/phosphodiesterase domain-containing protein n=1 Tax=Mugilogobius chulae TaxID=88201 RepID=A0AAW0P3P2_9GOBI